jgi:hypothetical protein
LTKRDHILSVEVSKRLANLGLRHPDPVRQIFDRWGMALVYERAVDLYAY